MNVILPQPWTREHFLQWAETQDEPHEFDGVRPVRMTRGNNNHGVLIRNLLSALDRRLGRDPCQVLGPESGIATTGGAVRYPDIVVTCSPVDGRARIVDAPVVVFEVLSPSSQHTDRIAKVREYAAVPSIRRYVMVEASFQGMTVLSRDPGVNAWTATTLADDDVLSMPEIGVELPLAEAYDRVTPDPDQG